MFSFLFYLEQNIIDILEKSYPYIKKLVYGEITQITISPVGKNTVKIPFCIHILNVKQNIKDLNIMISESQKEICDEIRVLS